MYVILAVPFIVLIEHALWWTLSNSFTLLQPLYIILRIVWAVSCLFVAFIPDYWYIPLSCYGVSCIIKTIHNMSNDR